MNASTYDPKSSTCGPVGSGHSNSPKHTRTTLGHLYPPWGQDTATWAAVLGTPRCIRGGTHSSCPALLVMQRPHATTSAWTPREGDRRECSVPQTQICCPSLTHIWSIQEKPAKSKHCAKWSIVSLAAQFPRHRDCQMGCSGGTPLLWPNAAPQASSLEHKSRRNLTSWLRSPLTALQPTERKSYWEIIRRKTLL